MAFHKAKALQEAEKSVTQGKISHAIKQYQEILANDPADVSLLNTIGDLYIRDRNMAEGLKQFHRLAEAFVREGFNVKAIAIYRKITKVDPSSVDTLLKLAELYQLQGLSREAREQYLQATEFFKKRNQADKAIEVLRKLVQLDPENVNFRNRMALECEQFGKREEAARAYLEAAEILLRHDDQVAAEAALKKAAAQDPKNTKVQFMRARLAIARQEPEEAERILNGTPELLEDASGRRILLDSYLALHRLPDAKRLVLEVIQTHPTDFEPVAAVSGLLVEKGDIDEAYQMLASVSDPLIAQHAAGPLLDALRRIWAAAPEHIATLELMHRICERTADESNLPEVLEALGHAYEDTGDLEKSEAAYLKLVEREPENENYRALFNDVQRKLGREIKPVDFASKELALTVDEPAAKPAVVDANQDAMVKEAFENSDLFSRYNLPDKAIAELEKVVQFYPDQVDVHRRILEIARKGFPERAAQAASQLARIFAAQGDHDMASKYHAIASIKGPLQDVQLPPAPASKRAPEPIAPPAPSAADIPMEFPLAAVSPEESVAAPEAPAPAAMSFDLTPPEVAVEPPPLPPPAPVPPPIDPSMEMDLSGDLEAFGFATPPEATRIEAAPPPPPAEPVVEPPSAELPPPIELPIETPAPAVELMAEHEIAPVEHELEVPLEEPHEPTVLMAAIDEEMLASMPEPAVEIEGPLTPLEEAPDVAPEAAPVHLGAAEPVAHQEVPLEPPVAAPIEPAAAHDEVIPADLDDSRIEVEFYLENGFIDEARQTLAALEEKYPSSHLVADLRRLYLERTAEAPAAEPPPVQAEQVEVAQPQIAQPEVAQPEVVEHERVREEPVTAEAPAIAAPVEESVELTLPEEVNVEPAAEVAPPAPEVEPEVAHQPEPVAAEPTPETAAVEEPVVAEPVAEAATHKPETAPAYEPVPAEEELVHQEVVHHDVAQEEVAHQEPVHEEVTHEETAHEEWELPTSYAASPGTPAEGESHAPLQAAEHPEHEEGAQEAEFSAPPHGQEFVIEDEAAGAGGGMDMLGDLAGDFASSLDGIAAGEEAGAAAPAASTASSSPKSFDFRGGASHLDGLLAEMEEPGEAESNAARDDPETHYNLGVAFREMGLLDESIGEFQKVVKGAGKGKFPPNFLQACSLLAICFMEKKMPNIAVKWYMRALETPGLDDEANLALHYDLGIAYEMAGDSRNALERFTEVYSQNIDFRDVAEKIRELQQKA